MATTTKAVPFCGGAKCYACDAPPVGLAEHGGENKPACTRHRWPSIRTYNACMYCHGPRPLFDCDGTFHHMTCHVEASR
jgi:hypothetical protein